MENMILIKEAEYKQLKRKALKSGIDIPQEEFDMILNIAGMLLHVANGYGSSDVKWLYRYLEEKGWKIAIPDLYTNPHLLPTDLKLRYSYDKNR